MTARKPTEIKRLAGTLRAGRVHGPEVQPGLASVRCPRDLPASAKALWPKVAPVLRRLGLLTELDLLAFRDLVLCASRLAQVERLIEKTGFLIRSSRGDGDLVKNPLLATATAYRRSLYQWCSKFGLTPSDRAGLQLVAAETQELDGFSEFLMHCQARATMRMQLGDEDPVEWDDEE